MPATVKAVVHLLPVIPFVYHWHYFGVAAILMVGILYIKSFKLTSQMNDLKAQDLDGTEEYRRLTRHRDFWKALTFLK